MKRILFSLSLIGFVSVAVLGLSAAFFSDTETSADNLFQAGSIDLKVDNTSYYNGVFNQGTSWLADDLDGNAYKFFNFLDLKPGDWGEDTISLRVDTNDAWACYNVELTSNDDNTCNEPESLVDQTCSEPNQNLFDGELAQSINFVLWKDDGDNVFETCDFNDAPEDCVDERPILKQGTLDAVVPTLTGALADSNGGLLGLDGLPMTGSQTYYLGKAWCFGDFTFNPVEQDGDGFTGLNGPNVRNSGIQCNGASLNNATQTDTLTADITFSAIQHRNNPGYLCIEEPVCSLLDAPAGSVLASNQGDQKSGADVLANRSIPGMAVNGAQGLVNPPQWFSLGFGGTITVELDAIAGNGPGTDLIIYEVTGGRDTYPAELAEVEISNDNSNWHYVGTANSQNVDGELEIDIEGAPISTFKYVRLTDVSDTGIHNSSADGFDVDFIKALYGDCVFPDDN